MKCLSNFQIFKKILYHIVFSVVMSKLGWFMLQHKNHEMLYVWLWYRTQWNMIVLLWNSVACSNLTLHVKLLPPTPKKYSCPFKVKLSSCNKTIWTASQIIVLDSIQRLVESVGCFSAFPVPQSYIWCTNPCALL